MVRGPGATVWLTGLPASGKTTLARAMEASLRTTGRIAIVLDGDELRRGLCADLGFSRAARAENARRAAHVAALVAEAGAVALVALVSPFAADRAAARELHAGLGLTFVEVWVNRPPADCERSDRKGLYAKARAGELRDLTGFDGVYEEPASPEVEIRPGAEPLEQSVERVLQRLSTGSAPASGGFAALRDAVLADPAAQELLRATGGWDDFAAAAAALAAERGIAIDLRDLELARTEARRADMARGI